MLRSLLDTLNTDKGGEVWPLEAHVSYEQTSYPSFVRSTTFLRQDNIKYGTDMITISTFKLVQY